MSLCGFGSTVFCCNRLLCGNCCERMCVTTCLALPDMSESLTQVCLVVYT